MSNLKHVLLVLAIVASAIEFSRSDDDEGMVPSMDEAIEMMESFSEGCDPKPTKEQLKSLLLNKEDVDRDTMCARSCFMNQFEMIEEGPSTQMNVDNVLSVMSMVYSDDKAQADLRVIVTECNTENKAITEECEAAHKHGICMVKKMKAKNYKMPEFKE